jgi:hypothetical protein
MLGNLYAFGESTMKRFVKATPAFATAVFLFVTTTLVLAAPCPPPPMSGMEQSAIEDLLGDYLVDMDTLHKECSNPAGVLVDALDTRAKELRVEAARTKDYSRKTAIEKFLKGKLAAARAEVAQFDIRLKDPCKRLKDRLDSAKKQLKAGGYPDAVEAMKAVYAAAETVCPKGAASLTIKDQKKVFGERVPKTDPAFNPALDALQIDWQDAVAIAKGALETTFK